MATGSSITVTPSASTIYYVRNYSGGLYSTNCSFGFVFVADAPNAAIDSAENTSCYGGSDGSIWASATGGSTPYGYSWSSGQTGATATGLGAGTYTVTVTDNNSCSSTAQSSISAPAQINISFSGTPASCPGSSDGSISASASGGSGSGYTYNWSTGGTSASVSGLTAATYTVTVTDGNNCTNSSTYTLTSGTSVPDPQAAASTSSICAGSGSGVTLSATINGSGPTFTQTTGASCSYTDGGNLNFTFTSTPLAIGNATLTVYYQGDLDYSTEVISYYGEGSSYIGTSNNTTQCGSTYASKTFTIPQSTINTWAANGSIVITADAALDVNAFCSQSHCGYMTISYPVFSGTTYWFSGSCAQNTGSAIGSGSSITVYPTATTTYYVANYQGSCWSLCDAVTVTVTPQPTVSASLSQNNICPGSSSTLSANGASTYLWSPSGGLSSTSGASVTASPTSTTTYTVTGTDANACTATASVTVNVYTAPSLSTSSTSPTCYGGTNGTASVVVNSGVSPYSYSWPNGSITTTATGLSAGNYTVTVTDGNTCTKTAVATVSNPSQVGGTLSVNGTTCSYSTNGQILVNPSGGSGSGYTFNWSNGGTAALQTGLTAGTYTVTITDGNSCTGTLQGTVNATVPVVAPSISATNINLCTGSSTNITASQAGGGSSNYSQTSSSACASTTGGSAAISFSGTPASASGNGTLTVYYQGDFGSATETITIYGEGSTYLGVSSQHSECTSVLSQTFSVSQAQLNSWASNGSISITFTASVDVNTAVCNSSSFCAYATLNYPTVTGTAYWFQGNFVQNTSSSIGTGSPLSVSPSSNTIYYVANLDGGCWSDPDSVTVTVVPLPTVSATASLGTICSGTSTTLTANGAQTYSWSPSTGLSATTGQSVTASPTASTTYAVYGTDANNCGNTAFVSVTVLQGPTLSTSFTQPSCNGYNNGTASVTPSGVSPFTYAWSTSSTTASTTGLTAGNYTVTVTDNNTCTKSTTVTVPQPSAVTGVVSTNAAQCWNSADGQAAVNASGGAGGYSYTWSNGSSSFVATNLSAGSYTVTITDANSCTGTALATISAPAQVPSLTIYTPNTSVCAGNTAVTLQGSGTSASNYSASSTSYCTNITGGTVSYTFSSTPAPTGNGQISVTYTGDLDASTEYLHLYADGTFIAQLNGGTQCTQTYTESFSVTQAQLASWAANGSIALTAYATSDVSSNICSSTAFCASFSIQYPQSSNIGYWFAGTFTQNTSQSIGSGASVSVSPSATTTYYYANYNGSCWSSPAQVTVTVNPLPSVSATSALSSICQGISTTLTANGASTYQWSPAGSLSSSSGSPVTATPTTTTMYTVTGTDVNGCTNTGTVTVNVAPTPAATLTPSNYNGYNISCNGGVNGAITATISGGSSPFSYSWAGPSGYSSINQNISSLAAGTYTLTVTGNNSCSDVATVTLTQPNALGLTNTLTNYNGYNVACNSGSNGGFDITPTGGVTPYSYTWTGPGSYSNTSQDATGISAGAYTVTVTDANGCTVTDSETLTQPTAIAVTSTLSNYNGSNISCNGEDDGSVTLSVSGGLSGYDFTWDGPGSFTSTSQNLSNIAAGVYTVSVEDANGCLETETFNISQPGVLDIAFSVTDVTCYAGHGTTGNDGSIATSMNGGTAPFTYAWSTGSTASSLSALASATYTLTVTDLNGCETTEPATVGFANNLPQPDLGADATLCQGETLVLNPGAYSLYNWSTGQTSATINATTTNNYTVTVTDNNTCLGEDTITVYFNPLPVVSLGANTSSCGPLTLAVGSGYSAYLWNTGGTTSSLTVTTSGTYSVTVTDANGCDGSDEITVTINPVVTVDMQSTETACGQNNGTATVNVTNGVAPYTYAWNNSGSTSSITGLGAGLYSVTVTDANSCTASSSVTVDNTDAPTVTASSTDLLCHGDGNGSASVTISGGTTPYSVLWSTGEIVPSIGNLSGGTYVVTVSDGAGCTEVVTVVVTEPEVISATSSSTPTNCGTSNGNATVFASGGTPPYSYEWNDAANQTTNNATGLSAGLYLVTITDDNNCELVKAVSVNNITAPELNIIGVDVSCAGDSNGSATVEATGGASPYTYLWNDSAAQTSATATGLAEGEYGVVVTDNEGCISSETVTIGHSFENPTVTLGPDLLIPQTTLPVTLDAGAGFITYTWQDTSAAQTFLAQTAGTYWVEVSDEHGCTGSDTLHIVLWATGITETAAKLDVTVFPNPTRGLLSIRFSSLQGEDVKIEVFTANGQFVQARTIVPAGTASQVEHIDLSGQAQGLYLLKIHHGAYSTVKRISVM